MAMTEEQKKYANEIVQRISERLRDNKHFYDVKYKWFGDTVDFTGSTKTRPGFAFKSMEIPLKNIANVDEHVDYFVERWNEITDKEVSDFDEFISFGTEYGWD